MGKDEELYGTLMIQAEIIQGRIQEVKRRIANDLNKPAPKTEESKCTKNASIETK